MNNLSFPPEFQNQRPTIAVDFDGVMHNDNLGFSDGTCYGEPIVGTHGALSVLSDRFRVVVFSAKARLDRPLIDGLTGVEHIQGWLVKHNLDKFIDEITAEKPRALLYIDDNAFRFEDWETALLFVNQMDTK